MAQKHTVKTLKAECKARGLKRYSKLRKADLYDLLRNNGWAA